MIYVKLLSEPQVFVEEEQILFPYKKAEGLFYYICYEKRITRDKAASLLWADNDEQTARKNLRNALYQIRKLLGPDVINQQGHTVIELNEDLVSVDVDGVNQSNIVDLYGDSFLGSHYIKNSIEYEDWVEQVKLRYQQMYSACIGDYISSFGEQSDYDRLSYLVDKAFDLPVVEEKIYRNAMMLYYKAGQFNEAIQIYKKLKNLLIRELDSEPERVTQKLYEEIAEANTRVRPESSEVSDSYFYGRQDELHELICSSQSVLIQGEAGVGKSSLISRFLEMINDHYINVIRYTCHQSGMLLPYRPIFDICQEIQTLLQDPMDLEQVLKDTNGDQIQYYIKMELFMEGLIRKVFQTTGKRILLIIDDWQWVDGDSAELIGNLIHHMQNKEIRFVIAARGEAPSALRKFSVPLIRNNLLKLVPLEPFSIEDTDCIIRELGADMVRDSKSVQSIYEMTKGNAFFLIEVLNQIRENGIQEIRDRLFKSASVKNIMDSRLFGIGEEDRKILEVLSCQTDFLTIREIQCVLAYEEETLVDALERFLEMRLIFEEETFCGTGYIFTHNLIQDYIYTGMTATRKKLFHRQLAEGIEGMMGKEVRIYPYLIYHYRACGNIVKMYTYKLEYFIKYYSYQHEVYPQDPEYFEGVTPWTQQLINSTAVDELVKEIRFMTEQALDEHLLSLRMKSEFLCGRYAIYRGQYEEGLEAIERCEALSAELGEPSYQFMCSLQRIFYSIQIGNHDMMKAHLDKIADQSQENYLNRYTYLRLLGLYYLKTGVYDQAEKTLLESIQTVERVTPNHRSKGIGSAVCYSYLGDIYFEKQEYEKAQAYFERAIEGSNAGDDTNGNGIFYVNMMKIMYLKSEFAEVRRYSDLARGAFDRAGAIWGVDEMEILLCAAYLKEGRLEEAMDHLLMAEKYANETRYPKSLKNILALRKYFEEGKKGEEPDVIL